MKSRDTNFWHVSLNKQLSVATAKTSSGVLESKVFSAKCVASLFIRDAMNLSFLLVQDPTKAPKLTIKKVTIFVCILIRVQHFVINVALSFTASCIKE